MLGVSDDVNHGGGHDDITSPHPNLEDEVVKEVLESGTDLREYSRQIETELKEVENASIQDYIKESLNIASLHNQIAACDNILERMETMLQGFQADLGSISNEIISLQKQSVTMSRQLHNRQAVRGQLSQFVDEMAVSEQLIKHILDTPVTERDFLSQVAILSHKIAFVKEQSTRDAQSCQDVKDILERLKIKAVTKIREFLLTQIYKFRKPMTNYQMPQNTLLKYKFYYEFLRIHERNVAAEIHNEYVDTMSKVYYSYFKSYSSKLMKLQYEEVPSKDDLMGSEECGQKNIFAKPVLKNRATVFTISNRGEILGAGLEAPIIVPHAAQKNDTKYPYEAIFRSEQFALVDNACREYLFLSEFFIVKDKMALDLFDNVLGRTLTALLKNVDLHVQDSYDAIGLFLCLHLVLRYRLLCHKRAVPALDRYFDALQDMIWPRFQYIVELNIMSVRDCDPQKLGTIDTRPHYIMRRYAEFSAALVGISESFPDERVAHLMAQLQEEVGNFILRMAAAFQDRSEQLIFVINNYDLMISILMERTRADSKEVEVFREQLTARSTEYADEVLAPHFGGIMQFVREGEALLNKGLSDELKKQERKALSLVQSFSSEWKTALEAINRKVLSSYPNLVLGSSLVQLALTQLVQYYHRFHRLLSPPVRSQLTNIHHIMVEVKKYRTSY